MFSRLAHQCAGPLVHRSAPTNGGVMVTGVAMFRVFLQCSYAYFIIKVLDLVFDNRSFYISEMLHKRFIRWKCRNSCSYPIATFKDRIHILTPIGWTRGASILTKKNRTIVLFLLFLAVLVRLFIDNELDIVLRLKIWTSGLTPMPHSNMFSRLVHQWAGPLVHRSAPTNGGVMVTGVAMFRDFLQCSYA